MACNRKSVRKQPFFLFQKQTKTNRGSILEMLALMKNRRDLLCLNNETDNKNNTTEKIGRKMHAVLFNGLFIFLVGSFCTLEVMRST